MIIEATHHRSAERNGIIKGHPYLARLTATGRAWGRRHKQSSNRVLLRYSGAVSGDVFEARAAMWTGENGPSSRLTGELADQDPRAIAEYLFTDKPFYVRAEYEANPDGYVGGTFWFTVGDGLQLYQLTRGEAMKAVMIKKIEGHSGQRGVYQTVPPNVRLIVPRITDETSKARRVAIQRAICRSES